MNFLITPSKVDLIQENCSIEPTLKAGIYNFAMDQQGNTFLTYADDIKKPTGVLGNLHQQTERILKTYKNRQKSTGVLLSGLKGSGKTLLTKDLAFEMVEAGKPVIIIANKFPIPALIDFIDSITVECMVILDEYEKHFNHQDQEQMLGILDGIQTSKKLFVLTSNSSKRVSEFLLNRPGRIYYHLKFGSLKPEDVIQYCKGFKISKDKVEDLLAVVKGLKDFSYDILVSIVEEMIRYDCTASDCMEWLNIDNSNEEIKYFVEFIPNNDFKEYSLVFDSVSVEPQDYYFDGFMYIDIKDKDYKTLKSAFSAEPAIKREARIELENKFGKFILTERTPDQPSHTLEGDDRNNSGYRRRY